MNDLIITFLFLKDSHMNKKMLFSLGLFVMMASVVPQLRSMDPDPMDVDAGAREEVHVDPRIAIILWQLFSGLKDVAHRQEVIGDQLLRAFEQLWNNADQAADDVQRDPRLIGSQMEIRRSIRRLQAAINSFVQRPLFGYNLELPRVARDLFGAR